jgi:hypothetical protein
MNFIYRQILSSNEELVPIGMLLIQMESPMLDRDPWEAKVPSIDEMRA